MADEKEKLDDLSGAAGTAGVATPPPEPMREQIKREMDAEKKPPVVPPSTFTPKTSGDNLGDEFSFDVDELEPLFAEVRAHRLMYVKQGIGRIMDAVKIMQSEPSENWDAATKLWGEATVNFLLLLGAKYAEKLTNVEEIGAAVSAVGWAGTAFWTKRAKNAIRQSNSDPGPDGRRQDNAPSPTSKKSKKPRAGG